MFKLVIQDDEGKTTVVPLIRDEITIGRKEGNTIRLTERNVSRRHARILRNNGEVQIEDLGSYNGIRVNNARIAERVSLRVSDQVQIGDYKLYLKAEGVEQVDDARTMPIERVDTTRTESGVTDVMAAAPAAASVSAPTAPMAMQTPAPGTLPPAAQLIGDPNRTLVAVADPQGRPVATPAQVAAVLSSPVGYGRLVVLSSNFAGKEFELSRPQMIIGRTDENDIVINHRSISRNHAKLTRDPENNRYTISDLQSSNGVRVNGQDYGKVELRRGDVVDLGHVRLRFVEPGEDFIFSRDAVITDVPDASSRKSLFIALGLAAVVVIGVIVVMLMRKDDKPSSTNGNNMATQTDAAPAVAQASDAADQMAAPVIDAAEQPKDDPSSAVRVRCKEAVANFKWTDAIACGEELKKYAPEEGQDIYKQAHSEQKAEASYRRLQEAVKTKNYGAAAKALKEIDESSVYRKDAVAANDGLLAKARADVTSRAKQLANNCASYDKAMRQFKNIGVPESVISDVKKEHGCTTVATRPDRDPPPDRERPCANADDDFAKGQEAFGKGRNQEALQLLDKAYGCKGDARILQLAFAAACKSKNLPKARFFWKKMSPGMQQAVASFCPNNGILLEQLNKP